MGARDLDKATMLGMDWVLQLDITPDEIALLLNGKFNLLIRYLCPDYANVLNLETIMANLPTYKSDVKKEILCEYRDLSGCLGFNVCGDRVEVYVTSGTKINFMQEMQCSDFGGIDCKDEILEIAEQKECELLFKRLQDIRFEIIGLKYTHATQMNS
eukprot:159795_1